MIPEAPELKSPDPDAETPPGKAPTLAWSWTYMQRVLDDALEAVQSARVRGEKLARAYEEQKRITSELEERCEELQHRVDASRREADSTHDSLDQIRGDHERLVREFEGVQITAQSFEESMKQLRRLDERFHVIADAINRLDHRVREVRAHYAGQLDASELISQEINFARDEALAQIRIAVTGLRVRRPRREPPRLHFAEHETRH